MTLKILIPLFVLSCAMLIGLIVGKTPSDATPMHVLAVFMFIYVVIFSLVSIFFRVFEKHMNKRPDGKTVFQKHSTRYFLKSLSRSVYHLLAVLAIAPVVSIALLSANGFGLLEFFLVFVFEIVLCFYILRRNS